jgi:hypothetical protein
MQVQKGRHLAVALCRSIVYGLKKRALAAHEELPSRSGSGLFQALIGGVCPSGGCGCLGEGDYG